MVFMVLLAIPAFGPLLPGMTSAWVKVLPSYGIVEGLLGAAVYDRGWAETAPCLGLIIAWDIVIVGSGLLVLKKKVKTL
jgi:ABC-2 type transport system permease protein